MTNDLAQVPTAAKYTVDSSLHSPIIGWAASILRIRYLEQIEEQIQKKRFTILQHRIVVVVFLSRSTNFQHRIVVVVFLSRSTNLQHRIFVVVFLSRSTNHKHRMVVVVFLSRSTNLQHGMVMIEFYCSSA
jgi:hypothetical protein